MKRKGMWVLAALLLVLSLSSRAEASEVTGTIQVNWVKNGGELALFPVGTWNQEGFTLKETYGGGYIKAEDIHSPALAQWLRETASQEGRYRLVEQEGTAVYSNVADGLYLLVQTEKGKADAALEPFLISMPYDGTWEIQVNPRADVLPPTGQDPGVFLGLAGMVLSGTGLAVCCWKRKK